MRFGSVSMGSLLLLLCTAACGGGGGSGDGIKAPTTDGMDGGSTEVKCIDEDGDGYGKGCGAARQDCNDDDPKILNDCYRCRYADSLRQDVDIEDCPCERGTKSKQCKPEDKVVDGGVFKCPEGTRYCRDGLWSRCEEVGQYVFVPN